MDAMARTFFVAIFLILSLIGLPISQIKNTRIFAARHKVIFGHTYFEYSICQDGTTFLLSKYDLRHHEWCPIHSQP